MKSIYTYIWFGTLLARLILYVFLISRASVEAYLYVYLLTKVACDGNLYVCWFLESPEGRFEAFLAPGPKPLPEQLIFIAREPFFGLDRISGFWRLQKAVLKHFWLLAKTIARTAYFHCARAIFRSGPNIWFLHPFSPNLMFRAIRVFTQIYV